MLTHRTPVGTYRGPGMTEATFVRERMLDLVADELGLDPAELRRRNLVTPAEMPFVYDLGPKAPPIVYDTGDFPAFFERLLDEAGYDGLRAERERRRAAGEAIGIGLAAGVELGAIGPFEEATITGLADGTFVVRTGIASLGQGVETVVAQIAASELDVPAGSVAVHHHDTADVASGFGSFASRSTVLAGNAVAIAAQALRAQRRRGARRRRGGRGLRRRPGARGRSRRSSSTAWARSWGASRRRIRRSPSARRCPSWASSARRAASRRCGMSSPTTSAAR